MKKKIAVILAALMLLTACGTKDTAEQTKAESNTPIPQTETSEVPQATAVPLVLELTAEDVVLKGEGTVPSDTAEISYQLPQLNTNAPVAKEFDAWVDEIYNGWMLLLNWYPQWIDDPSRVQLNYKAAVYHDILTVEFLINEQQAMVLQYNCVFSIDLRTGEQLTVDGVLDRAGITREELYDIIRENCQSSFDYEDSQYGEIQGIQEFRQKLNSSENLDQLVPMISIFVPGSVQVQYPNVYTINTSTTPPTAESSDSHIIEYLDILD